MVGRSFPAFSSPAQSRVAYFRLVLSGTHLTDLRNAILSLICCVLLHLTCLCSAERRLVAPASPRFASVASLCLSCVARSAWRRFAWFASLCVLTSPVCSTLLDSLCSSSCVVSVLMGTMHLVPSLEGAVAADGSQKR